MELLKRSYYCLRMLHRHYHSLAVIYHNSPRHYSLQQLSPRLLKQQGIHILVLDFDGVLAAHGEIYPLDESATWLRDSVAIFGTDQVFILTNNPLSDRIAYFNQYFSGIRCITATKKKPYPEGLEKILALTQQPAEAVMLIDDRLLTGALAACIANVRVTYITHPYVCLAKRPIQEAFFMGLRFLERLLVRWYYLFLE